MNVIQRACWAHLCRRLDCRYRVYCWQHKCVGLDDRKVFGCRKPFDSAPITIFVLSCLDSPPSLKEGGGWLRCFFFVRVSRVAEANGRLWTQIASNPITHRQICYGSIETESFPLNVYRRSDTRRTKKNTHSNRWTSQQIAHGDRQFNGVYSRVRFPVSFEKQLSHRVWMIQGLDWLEASVIRSVEPIRKKNPWNNLWW